MCLAGGRFCSRNHLPATYLLTRFVTDCILRLTHKHNAGATVMFRPMKPFLIAGLIAVSLLWPLHAFAGSANLVLVRSTLSNDADADGGGLWQYEGGAVQNKAGSALGTYIIERRVTTSGTQTYNTAAETLTLFLAPGSSGGLPPVITIEGDYSYKSGAVGGSVAAAGGKYHWLIGADANATVGTPPTTNLVITWTASDSLHVP